MSDFQRSVADTLRSYRDRGLFSRVVDLPKSYVVLDFSNGEGEPSPPESPNMFSIGRYNELRLGLYQGPAFKNRCVHMGVDIGAPAGTFVRCFFDGEIHHIFDESSNQGFGPTIVTRHQLEEYCIFCLHAHLTKASLTQWSPGHLVAKGTLLGEVGSKAENGGWNPHLHFQLSLRDPKIFEIQGVVSLEERESSLGDYPDPLLVLGTLY